MKITVVVGVIKALFLFNQRFNRPEQAVRKSSLLQIFNPNQPQPRIFKKSPLKRVKIHVLHYPQIQVFLKLHFSQT